MTARMSSLLYIVRHCEAAGNKERFFQGQHDGGISELGEIQLSFLAERFREINIDAIYSSPLTRARMTAEAEQLGADAVVCVRFATSAIMQGAAEVMAYGTAVKFI